MTYLQNLSSQTCQNSDAGKKKILIIDDSADILLLNRMILETEDYEVLTAESGSKALALLENMAEPNLILLDMRMESMSGSEFLTELEAKFPNISKKTPVVFLSGSDDLVDSRVSGSIRKPIGIEEFVETVHRYIEKGIVDTKLFH